MEALYNSIGGVAILICVFMGLEAWRRYETRRPFYRSYTKLVFDYRKINKK